MPLVKITGPCAITICKRVSTQWRRVSENFISKALTSNTLPSYLQLGDTVCSSCYNGIAVNGLLEFKQHSQAILESGRDNEVIEIENTNTIVSFSQAIEIITDILYDCEKKEKKSTIYSYDEFKATMEEKDIRLKSFFKELYLSSNPSSKNSESKIRVKKQLLFVCYFLCGIRNKFVNNAKRDLAIYIDSVGASNSLIDTLADLGVTTTSRTVDRHKTAISEEHANNVDSTLAEYLENAMVLNIDDYHNIHGIKMPTTTITSTAVHLATILMNPITTQQAISRINIHNPRLVDAELIKTNIENKFMNLYSLSHNQRWGFRVVDDDTRLEELTVHSYDVRLKEKRSSRSMKETILVNLQKNDLHSIDAYLQAVNAVVNVPSMQQYIQKGYLIPVVADWPGQIHLRTAISCYLFNRNLPNINDSILSFLPIIGPLHILLNSRELIFLKYQPFFSAMYSYIFGERKVLPQNPKPWRINLLLEISRSAWQEVSTAVESKFGSLCKDAEYLTLKDLLDNTIPLVLDIYTVLFRSGDFEAYLESCFRVWTIFLKFSRRNYTKAPLMFLSDIFYWELNQHPILGTIKAELPKFSDSTVEIFHSFLRRGTQKHTDADQLIKYGHYINLLRLDSSGFRENFTHTSSWTYPSSSKRKREENFGTFSLTAMNMPEAQLWHLPLGFSPIEVLSCGHTYHKFCYNNNGSKCLHCLAFLQNGIDEHVQSLQESLLNPDKKKNKKKKTQAKESEENNPCDYDDEIEPINYRTSSLEKALREFQSQ
ncbi:hypothetical protein C2G38_2207130 [Gigaspora rosea]|uniref:Uncharacterized protein n=1 Tax=Gigaspora rosea TaxID=44941 RepID=A0A397USA2_9GLOM|nr:hypothetical protein C2G38_2207130 [Gigaspora rosea]